MESDFETVEKTNKLCSLMNMGKKSVITGTLLSYSPVLLPPFIAISALGLAVSVPFGIMYASYACTDEGESGLVSTVDDGKEEECIVSIDNAQNLAVQREDGGKKELGELLEMKSEKVVEIKGVDKEKKRLNVVKGIVRRRKKRKEGEGVNKYEQERELQKQTETTVPEKALQEESSRISNEKEPVAGNVDDKKIWDEIDAIRAIIGFQSPRRPSYLEELQALYLCAGIELPSSAAAEMDASADHANFDKKLRFLMSVIELK